MPNQYSDNKPRLCICGCGQQAKRCVYNGEFKSWRLYAAGHAPRERNEVRIPEDTHIIAYAAGIVDGEGCVFAKAFVTSDNTYSTMIQVQVAMCSEDVVKWLYANFGGRCYTYVPKTGHTQYKRRWSWQVVGKRVIPLLTALLPYLIEKRRRAELAIQLASMITGNSAPVSPEQRRERESLAAEIKALNRQTSHVGKELIQ